MRMLAQRSYMEMMGISGSLLPLVILIEIGGGLALLVGFQTRIVALGVGRGLHLVAGMIFSCWWCLHSEQITNNSIHLMKNIALSRDGFLFVMLQERWQVQY